jgi:hypothetical protein
MAAGGSALWGHSGRRLWRGSSQRGSPHPGALRGSESGTRSSPEKTCFEGAASITVFNIDGEK